MKFFVLLSSVGALGIGHKMNSGFTKLEAFEFCSSPQQHVIMTKSVCVNGAKQLGLGSVEVIDDAEDFPGCFYSSDGRFMWFNSSDEANETRGYEWINAICASNHDALHDSGIWYQRCPMSPDSFCNQNLAYWENAGTNKIVWEKPTIYVEIRAWLENPERCTQHSEGLFELNGGDRKAACEAQRYPRCRWEESVGGLRGTCTDNNIQITTPSPTRPLWVNETSR